jgi:hypothetical protein
LKEARAQCPYPALVDFSRAAQISDDSCWEYERGRELPPQATLENIIKRCSIPEGLAAKLRVLHMEARVARANISVVPAPTLDVSELAEKIQREVDYELKRVNIQLTPQTRRVCVRRIGMLLNDALGVK